MPHIHAVGYAVHRVIHLTDGFSSTASQLMRCPIWRTANTAFAVPHATVSKHSRTGRIQASLNSQSSQLRASNRPAQSLKSPCHARQDPCARTQELIMKDNAESTSCRLSVLAHMPLPPMNYHPEAGLPVEGMVRLPTILKCFPVSRSAWWAGVKSGIYPAGIKISPRCTAWRVEDIRELLSRFSRKQ